MQWEPRLVVHGKGGRNLVRIVAVDRGPQPGDRRVTGRNVVLGQDGFPFYLSGFCQSSGHYRGPVLPLTAHGGIV